LTKTLWTIQVLLAGLFIFAGGFKLVTPIEEMVKQMPVALSGGFLQFIGVCEVLGGLGMILPGLLRIKTGLTPLAAVGLVIIMIGATATSLMAPSPVTALFPFATGVLAAFVAYGRWKISPIASRA